MSLESIRAILKSTIITTYAVSGMSSLMPIMAQTKNIVYTYNMVKGVVYPFITGRVSPQTISISSLIGDIYLQIVGKILPQLIYTTSNNAVGNGLSTIGSMSETSYPAYQNIGDTGELITGSMSNTSTV